MKAILEFNLPEDRQDFNFANHGSDWWNVCWELDQWLRSQTKHAPDSMSEDTYNAFEQCRDRLRDIITEQGLLLDQ